MRVTARIVGSVATKGCSTKDLDILLEPQPGVVMTTECGLTALSDHLLPLMVEGDQLNPLPTSDPEDAWFVNLGTRDGRTVEFFFPSGSSRMFTPKSLGCPSVNFVNPDGHLLPSGPVLSTLGDKNELPSSCPRRGKASAILRPRPSHRRFACASLDSYCASQGPVQPANACGGLAQPHGQGRLRHHDGETLRGASSPCQIPFRRLNPPTLTGT